MTAQLECETETVAWSYGCPAWYELPGDAVEQLRLGRLLWNRLVEGWRLHEEAKAAIWATGPGVRAAQERLDAAQEAVDAAYGQIRESRQADRSTIPRNADREALAAAEAERDASRTVRDAAREAAFPGLREAFGAAKGERLRAQKALYPEFTAMGLGWGSFNDVTRRRFPLAVAKVEALRKEGKPAELSFRRWDGTGTLTVQVMGAARMPPRTVPALNSGCHPRSGMFRLEPWRAPADGRGLGEERHGMLRLTIGRSREHGPLHLDVPVVVDRYMPADAEVREVKVSRFREGTRFRVRVSVVCSQPRAFPAPQGKAVVAVRLSWRATGDGGAVVAHIGSPRPLPPPPASLAGVVRASEDRRSAEVLYRADWRRLLDRDAAIRKARDENTDIVRDKITLALRDEPGLAEALAVTAGEVSRWKAPRRFAALAGPASPAPGSPGHDGYIAALRPWLAAEEAWKAAHPLPERGKGWRQRMLREVGAELGAQKPRLPARWPEDHPLSGVLAEWRDRDRHLWQYEETESAQVLRGRRDAYRNVAAWLCAGASQVVIDGTDLAREKRAPGDAREDPEGARGARRLMHAAAPGQLRAALEAAAARRGIPVTAVKGSKGGRQ